MGDKFDVSKGNLAVLESIPKMMSIPEWREKIRILVLDYISSQSRAKVNKKNGF